MRPKACPRAIPGANTSAAARNGIFSRRIYHQLQAMASTSPPENTPPDCSVCHAENASRLGRYSRQFIQHQQQLRAKDSAECGDAAQVPHLVGIKAAKARQPEYHRQGKRSCPARP